MPEDSDRNQRRAGEASAFGALSEATSRTSSEGSIRMAPSRPSRRSPGPARDSPSTSTAERTRPSISSRESSASSWATSSAARPGSFVFIPRGVPHTWQVVGKRNGRMLVTFFPAGMEGFFDRLSSMTEFDLDEFKGAASAHGMEVVGPPLAQSDPL